MSEVGNSIVTTNSTVIKGVTVPRDLKRQPPAETVFADYTCSTDRLVIPFAHPGISHPTDHVLHRVGEPLKDAD